MKYLGKKTDNLDIATQNDLSSSSSVIPLTADLYLNNFNALPNLTSGAIYYTGIYQVYVNGTVADCFWQDCYFLYVADEYSSYAMFYAISTSLYLDGYVIEAINSEGDMIYEAKRYASLKYDRIDTTLPYSPLDTKVPSTKLLKTQLNLKANATDLANKQDILATTLTADIYLVDGTAPTLADGTYYTGTHKIYVNGTEASEFNNVIFTVRHDEYTYEFTKIYGGNLYNLAIITCDLENSNEYFYGYTNWVKQTDITTTMPPNVSSAIWDKRVPSTKLFKTQLDLKANSSSLGSLASLNSIDYTSNYITNKPTIPTSAADVGAMPASSVTTAFWTGTQAEYDALGSYSSTTLYLIHE